MTYRVRRGSDLLIAHVEEASSPLARMRGLLGEPGLPPYRGLHLVPCTALHTCFMRFTIDAFFLDREHVVVRAVRRIRPFRFVPGGGGARSAVEVASGWLPAEAVKVGDRLVFEPVD